MQQNFKHWTLPNSPDTEDGGVGSTPSGSDQPSPESPGATPDPNAGLKKALESERKIRSEFEQKLKLLERQLKAFEGIDPELAKRAQELQAQQEEMLQRESKLRAEIEASYQPQLAEAKKREAEKEAELQRFKLDVQLEKAFFEQGGFPGEFEPVALALRSRAKLEPNGSIKVLDKSGNPMFVNGEPATIADLIADLQKTEVWFARHFKGYEASGMGLGGSAMGGVNDPSLSNLPPWERVAALRAKQGK